MFHKFNGFVSEPDVPLQLQARKNNKQMGVGGQKEEGERSCKTFLKSLEYQQKTICCLSMKVSWKNDGLNDSELDLPFTRRPS